MMIYFLGNVKSGWDKPMAKSSHVGRRRPTAATAAAPLTPTAAALPAR